MRFDSKWIKDEFDYDIKSSENLVECENQKMDFMYNSDSLSLKIHVIKELLNRQILNLYEKFNHLLLKDMEIFEKLVISNNENNIQYSTLLLSELYDTRATCKAILVSKIILEERVKKFDNFSDSKKLTENLSILFSIICNINSLLRPQLCEFNESISIVSKILKDLLIDIGYLEGNVINFMESNNQVKKLVEAANESAEKRIKNLFRSLNNIVSLP